MSDDEVEANARLIAAADMIDALRGALFALDENADGSGPSERQAIACARAAIAKATAGSRKSAPNNLRSE